MRIIQADCTIRYTGRCETFLPEACRLILIKDDGSVMIHVDSGIKPLNYMKSSKNIQFLEQDGHTILYAGNTKEELYVDLLAVRQDVFIPFPEDDAQMVKTGTEDLLQEEIFSHLCDYVEGHEPVCREFETGKGPVDVFGMNSEKTETSIIEVKRHAHRKDVYQVLKYGDAVDIMVADNDDRGVEAIEAKRKGDHDESGTMVPVEALRNRKLYLASRKFARGTKEEAAEHDVGIIEVADESISVELDDNGTPVPDASKMLGPN